MVSAGTSACSGSIEGTDAGVVVFFKHRPGKRVYRVLRVPESVARRVHRRMEEAQGSR